MALGALIIQKKYNYSDRELIEQLTENPYYQYFIGLPGFQEEPPFDASALVLFRKRLDEQILMEANNYMISAATNKKDTDSKDDDQNPPSGTGSSGSEKQSGEKEKEPVNSGTVILDASCTPVNVRFPQDVSLLSIHLAAPTSSAEISLNESSCFIAREQVAFDISNALAICVRLRLSTPSREL